MEQFFFSDQHIRNTFVLAFFYDKSVAPSTRTFVNCENYLRPLPQDGTYRRNGIVLERIDISNSFSMVYEMQLKLLKHAKPFSAEISSLGAGNLSVRSCRRWNFQPQFSRGITEQLSRFAYKHITN